MSEGDAGRPAGGYRSPGSRLAADVVESPPRRRAPVVVSAVAVLLVVGAVYGVRVLNRPEPPPRPAALTLTGSKEVSTFGAREIGVLLGLQVARPVTVDEVTPLGTDGQVLPVSLAAVVPGGSVLAQRLFYDPSARPIGAVAAPVGEAHVVLRMPVGCAPPEPVVAVRLVLDDGGRRVTQTLDLAAAQGRELTDHVAALCTTAP